MQEATIPSWIGVICISICIKNAPEHITKTSMQDMARRITA